MIIAKTLCQNCRFEYAQHRMLGERITFTFHWLSEVITKGRFNRFDDLLFCPRCEHPYCIVEIEEVPATTHADPDPTLHAL